MNYEIQEPVVRSLDLRVNPGEHVAFVGRSGCGKSILAADRTIITIAHRLSTILICDRAVFMKKGEIVAEEKPGEMFGNEKFAALFQQQYEGV